MQKSSITCINLCLYLKDDAEAFLKVLKAHLIPESTVLPLSTSKRDKKHEFASIIQEQKDSSKGKGLSKLEKCINQEEKDSSKGKGMSKTDKCRNEGAFNLAKAVREMKRDANQHIRPRKGNSHGQSKEILDNSINLDEACKYWIESFGLLISDKRILESNRSWLNASIIDTSLRLLAAQFKGISGFQGVGCSFTMSFTIYKTFIQIIHDESRNHWLTISTLDTDEPFINVYAFSRAFSKY